MIFQLTCRDNVGSLSPMRLSPTVPSSQNAICCNEYRCNVSKKVSKPHSMPSRSNGGRIQWVSGRPGEPPAYAGTDFIVARDGRIAAVYLFFDKLP
jgi:hypothetical protein